ncbi:MAG: PKD domain-containing protein [Bacteroidota bacterium]
MKNVFGILLFVFAALLVSCSEEGDPTPEPEAEEVTAEFSAAITDIQAGQSVSFTDQSAGQPTSWQWTFEGGEPTTSTEQNPVVVYNAPGIYDVKLIVSNDGSEHTQTKSELIKVESTTETDAVEANFAANKDSVTVGGSVQFTDASTGNITSWNWTFEGGSPATSTEQNPIVIYDSPGSYAVSLTVSDGDTEHTLPVDSMVVVVEDTGDFTLAGQWLLEDNSTGVLMGSIVEYNLETNEATLVHIETNTHCFELGDASWIDIEATDDGFTLKEMYRNCITHIYAESSMTIVNENELYMEGEFQGVPFNRTWVRYESEAMYDLNTYLEGTWEDVSEEKVFAGIKIKADLTTGKGVVVDKGDESLCWEVDDLAWDEIQPAVTGSGYWVSGLVKDCASEGRITLYIRIVDENNFHYETELGDILAEFKRVEE